MGEPHSCEAEYLEAVDEFSMELLQMRLHSYAEVHRVQEATAAEKKSWEVESRELRAFPPETKVMAGAHVNLEVTEQVGVAHGGGGEGLPSV